MANEAYCRAITHNTRVLVQCMFEHGIVPRVLVPREA
jgi:hypothetical protein